MLLLTCETIVHSFPLPYTCAASKDDLHVVLWLTPTWSSSDSAVEDPSTAPAQRGVDGLRIYDEQSAGKLFSQGVSVYPSAHCDFLSRSSSLAIDLQSRCNVSASEFVPRVPNRMVVVRARKLCTLLSPGLQRAEELARSPQAAAAFDQTTMIALVIVLSPSHNHSQ